jgi:alpha-galactosidase
VNIDDGWEADQRDSKGELLPNEKFPNFKELIDYIHGLGLKFGIYSSPGATTCGGYPGSYQHELIDATSWAEWGVDYLKYDYCGYLDIEEDSEEKTIQYPYLVMREALDKVNRDIVYCVGYGAPNVWNWAPEAGGNQWRTTRDITDEWNVVTAIGTFQDVCAASTAPGKNNDPDMLVVGKLGQPWASKIHDSRLTPDEQYSHISLWSILSAPLLLGCDMGELDDFTMNLLTNNEVLAVNQDPMVSPAEKMIVENGQVWTKKLHDGSYAVGFFHVDPYFILWDQEDANKMQIVDYPFELALKKIGINGKAKVRDLWRQQDLGIVENIVQATVPYHGVSLLRITPYD